MAILFIDIVAHLDNEGEIRVLGWFSVFIAKQTIGGSHWYS